MTSPLSTFPHFLSKLITDFFCRQHAKCEEVWQLEPKERWPTKKKTAAEKCILPSSLDFSRFFWQIHLRLQTFLMFLTYEGNSSIIHAGVLRRVSLMQKEVTVAAVRGASCKTFFVLRNFSPANCRTAHHNQNSWSVRTYIQHMCTPRNDKDIFSLPRLSRPCFPHAINRLEFRGNCST